MVVNYCSMTVNCCRIWTLEKVGFYCGNLPWWIFCPRGQCYWTLIYCHFTVIASFCVIKTILWQQLLWNESKLKQYYKTINIHHRHDLLQYFILRNNKAKITAVIYCCIFLLHWPLELTSLDLWSSYLWKLKLMFLFVLLVIFFTKRPNLPKAVSKFAPKCLDGKPRAIS